MTEGDLTLLLLLLVPTDLACQALGTADMDGDATSHEVFGDQDAEVDGVTSNCILGDSW